MLPLVNHHHHRLSHHPSPPSYIPSLLVSPLRYHHNNIITNSHLASWMRNPSSLSPSLSVMKYLSLFLLSISARATYALASPSKPQLKYFDLRGAAETCRVIFALANQDYEDLRYAIDPKTFASPAFLAAKESGELKVNLNRAPVLVTDGKTIGQSKAIERYLAKKFGLMGSTLEDEAMIDCIAEHCRDVKDAARTKGFSRFTKNKSDEEKAAARKEWFETDMPEMLLKMEEAVKATSGSIGYSFGAETTYADVAIWSLLRDCPASDLEDTIKASEKCSLLNSIADQVASNVGVAKWLKERPESMF
jgi:glutathione S-transferase